MRKLVMGCAMAGLIVLSPKSEARPPNYPGPLPVVFNTPKGVVGMASWYGMERQGKPTSSGEIFDQNGFTAAHQKLPFGTMIRVTNLKNFESTMVRVNDRGPGINGRIIDVSWAAAKKLRFLETGLTRVEVEVIAFPQNCTRQPPRASYPKVN